MTASPGAAVDARAFGGSARASRLRDDRDFRRYWWSRTLSTAGDIVTMVALPVLIYRVSGSPLLTALTSAFEAAPYVLFGLLAGALADRWDRRKVMVVADVTSALLVASVPVAFFLGVLTIPQVLAVAFLGPAIAVFFDGANFGALPLLVGRKRIAEANSVVWGAQSAAELVLPSLVGMSLAVVRPAPLLIADALSFAASAMLVRSIARMLSDRDRIAPPLGVKTLASEVAVGLRFVRDHRQVRAMTIISFLQCLSGGGFVALMVPWCAQVLHVGTAGWRFGLVYSGWSVGALAAYLGLPRLLRLATPAQITVAALPFSAVLGVTTALVPSWPLAGLGMLAWAIGYTLVSANAVSYRQQVTPEPLLSRVNTTGRMLAWGLGWTGGALAGGALAQFIDVRHAMVAMASIAFLGIAVAWRSPLRSAVSSQHIRVAAQI